MHFLFAANLRSAGIPHAFTTRQGGVSGGPFASLNLGRGVDDDPAAVAHNRAAVLQALGLDPAGHVEASQVHGAVVAVVDGAGAGRVIEGADGMVTGDPQVVLTVHAADCVPLLLADPRQGVVAAVHAGWKGTAAGVVVEAVRVMADRFDGRPEDLLAAIGPSIGPCHYEVDEPVLVRFRVWPWRDEVFTPNDRGRWQLDLREANRRQLVDAGVPAAQIEVIDLCTYDHPDLFFSHRRDRITGRMAAVIAARTRGNPLPTENSVAV